MRPEGSALGVQAEEHEDFMKRSLFYSSKAYSQQIKKWEDYDKFNNQ